MSVFIESLKFEIRGAGLSFRSAWKRAVNVYEAREDGYPYSLKEVWDAQTNLTCAMLRNCVEDLVRSYPRIPETYIKGLLNTPTHFQHMGGQTPFQAVLNTPNSETLGNAKIAIRRDVYDLDEMMTGRLFSPFNRSFFAPELKNSK